MIKLAIFASGRGTNAEAIIKHFTKNTEVTVALIVCNNPHAGVVALGKKYGIPVETVTKQSLYQSESLLKVLKQNRIGFIVLAGFMWLIPAYIIDAFPGKIVNIHPALLPLHGGKGMYGRKVHEAVISSGDKESGITVHYVNSNFDEGEVIFQAKCRVEPGDDTASLEARVQKLEHLHYPQVIEKLLIKETVT